MRLLFWICLGLGVVATAILLVPLLRQWLLTPVLLNRFRGVMPPLSPTEREAIEAGSTWWDAELFSGRPRWERLLGLPAPHLSPEEEDFLAGPVDRLCRLLDDWRITHEDLDLPPAAWELIRRERLFGLVIPKDYGGLGFSPYAHSQVVMRLASRSVTAAVTVMVPNSLGPAELLLRYGTDAQRRRYLPRLARGEETPCFALTSPQAGSDAAAIPDLGLICQIDFEGRRTLGIRLSFEKRYITLGPIATLIGLAFRVRDPDLLLGEDPEPGITLALIPASTPGIEQGRRHLPLGIPFENGPLSGHDVSIPLDWVVGGREGIGKGWRMLMECLAEGRGISLPALATGAGKLAARYSGAYARIRRQFGQPIGYFEGLEAPLARIAGRTYQMDAARRVFLAALGQGERPAVLAAVLKYHLTELQRLVANDAMDIQAGSGICLGPRNLMGRVYQAAPIAITVEGANLLTRNLIIFGQGALRAHPWLLSELRAAEDQDPSSSLARFDRAVRGHGAHLLVNLARALVLGLSRGRLAPVPEGSEHAQDYRRLGWMAAAFAVNADLVLMALGASLKRRERTSARLGDLLARLFLACAVLKHHQDLGAPPEDLPLLRWALEDHLAGTQEALLGLWRNLPSRTLAWALRLITFPSGRPTWGPSDALEHQVARLILEPGEVRDRLTEGIHLSEDPEESAGRLDLALEAVARAEPIERRLRQALARGTLPRTRSEADRVRVALDAQVIRPDEAAAIRRAEQLREAVIQVDSFATRRWAAASEAPPMSVAPRRSAA